MSDEKDFLNVVEESTRGGYYLFVGNTLATLILFFSSTIVAQLLGPENYGVFSLVIVVPSILIGVFEFGIVSAITKFLAEFRNKNKKTDVERVIKTGFLLLLGLGTVGTILCFIFSKELATFIINTPEAEGYVKVASVLILFQTLFNALAAIFVGLGRMGNNAIILIIRAVTKLVLSLVLLLLGFSVNGALIGHISCYVVAVGLGLVFLIFKFGISKEKDSGPNSDILKNMLKYGFPIYSAGLLGLFFVQYETIILSFFSSKFAIGNFQVTTLFRTILSTIIYPFITLFPAFSKLDPHGIQLNQFFKRTVKYTAILVVPTTVAIIVMSNDLILAFYGPEYTLAATFVALSSLGSLYSGIGGSVFDHLFNGIGRTDVVLKSTIIRLILVLPLVPLFTYLYGIIGMIGALLLSLSFSMGYFFFTATKKLKLNVDVISSAKIFLSSAIAAVFVFLFIQVSPFNGIINLIIGGVVFVFSYLTLLPVIGVLNSTDIEIFRLQSHKIKSVWPILKIFLAYETKILNYVKK